MPHKMFRHLGSDSEIGPIDFRLICATNKNLIELVAAGLFRIDLYYRLCGKLIHIPPLRERTEDIPALVRLFAKGKDISWEGMEVLQSHSWKGNVRELRYIVENASERSDSEISRAVLVEELAGMSQIRTESSNMDFFEMKKLWGKGSLSPKDLQAMLDPLYRQEGGKLNKVAQRLGLNPSDFKRFSQLGRLSAKTGYSSFRCKRCSQRYECSLTSKR